ncbi:MAG: tetratricopeptide repeat protein [Lactobacillales bacterium]|jgi:tetratricopeptide (TPR) repeat protein|nr:tetratricopeptide repeat protein [Lactobacillales bacterium]
MSIRNKFLSKVHIGDEVKIQVGNTFYQGTVSSLSNVSVQIKTTDTDPELIDLEKLDKFEILENVEINNLKTKETTATFMEEYNRIDAELKNMAILPKKLALNIKTIEDNIKIVNNALLRIKLIHIMEMFQNTIKLGGANPENDRFSRILTDLDDLFSNSYFKKNCNKVLFLLKGYVLYFNGYYKEAANCFINAREYENAMVFIENGDDAVKCAFLALFEGGFSTRAVAMIYLIGKDAIPIWKVLLASISDITTDRGKAIFRAAFATYFKFGELRNNLSWPVPEDFFDQDNLEYFKNIHSICNHSIPSEMLLPIKERMKEYKAPIINSKSSKSNKFYKGKVVWVNIEGEHGMIHIIDELCNFNKLYLHFPFSEIKDNDLKKQIIDNKYVEIVFTLGKDQWGNIANNIHPLHSPVMRTYNWIIYTIVTKNVDKFEEASKKMQNLLKENGDELYTNGKLESAISNYAGTLNMKLGWFEDAIEIIEKYYDDIRVSRERLLTLHTQILERILHIQDIDRGKIVDDQKKLLELCNEIIEITQKQVVRMQFIYKKANLLLNMQKHDEAIKYYMQLQRIKESSKGALGDEYMDYNVKLGIAICYFKKGETVRAQEIAKELIKIYADNIVAKSILDGTFNDEIILKKIPTDKDTIEEFDYSVEYSSDITEFVKEKRENIINTFMESLLFQNGKFKGTPEQARQAINDFINKCNTPFTKMKYMLIASEIINQILINNKNKNDILSKFRLTKEFEKIYAGKGMAGYGSYFAQDLSIPNDSVTFILLNALMLLPEEDHDWINSLNLYIFSYFSDRSGVKEFAQKLTGNNYPNINYDIFLNNNYTNQKHELLIGLLYLLRALKKNKNVSIHFNNILEKLYESPLKEKIYENFMSIKNTFSFNTLTKDQFFNFFNNLIIELGKMHNFFDKEFDNCIKHTCSYLKHSETLKKLQQENYQILFCYTDKKYLSEIIDLQKMIDNYHSSNEFEDRVYILSQFLIRIKMLCEKIEECPTHLSFKYILQRLYRQNEIIENELINLHEEYLPKLTISLTYDSAYIGENGIVKLYLSINNRQGHQLADNIKIHIAESQILSLSDSSNALIRGIKGGETNEAILSLQLKQNFLHERVCDITLNLTYKYNNINSETITSSLPPYVFTLNLYSKDEFTKIENPYSGKIGSVMKDKNMFKGRSELIDKIVSQIRTPDYSFNKSHAVALYGQTRAGKSSILFHCKNSIRDKYGTSAIIIDYESAAETENLLHFLHNIIDLLINELRENHKHLYLLIKQEKLIDYPNKITSNDSNARIHFSTFFIRLNRILSNLSEEKIIILLIDEFTSFHNSIKDGIIPTDFMKIWKAIIQNYGIYAIVIGQDNMPFFMEDYPNEFASMQIEQVTYLDNDAAEQLMSDPILHNKKSRYKQGALEKLFNLTAGSPYLTLILCDKLVDYLNSTKSIYITRTLVDEFLREKIFCSNSCLKKTTFEPQLRDKTIPNLEEKNRKILLSIARAQLMVGSAEFHSLKCKDLPEEELRLLINRLVVRNVISIRENRYYTINVQLLGEWLLFSYGKE